MRDKVEDYVLRRQLRRDGQSLPRELCVQIVCQRKSIGFDLGVSDTVRDCQGRAVYLGRVYGVGG